MLNKYLVSHVKCVSLQFAFNFSFFFSLSLPLAILPVYYSTSVLTAKNYTETLLLHKLPPPPPFRWQKLVPGPTRQAKKKCPTGQINFNILSYYILLLLEGL